MVAGGGASGLNIVPIARELGCRPGAAPQHGRRAERVRRAVLGHHLRVHRQPVRGDPPAGPRRGQRDARGGRAARPVRSWTRSKASRRSASELEFMVDARYRGQVWELTVPLPASRLRGAEDVDGARGGVPRRPRARVRGARARPVPRVPDLEGARHREPGQARGAPAAGTSTATPPSRPSRRRRYFRGHGAHRRAALRRRDAARRHPHRGAGRDPRADDDRRRLPRARARSSRRPATT